MTWEIQLTINRIISINRKVQIVLHLERVVFNTIFSKEKRFLRESGELIWKGFFFRFPFFLVKFLQIVFLKGSNSITLNLI